jgi:hypothetical protein
MSTLHHSTITFFESKMSTHTKVRRFTRNATVPNEHIYEIERKDGLPSVTVLLSDAYRFGHADYLGRPPCIRRGDYILIARPEADFDASIIKPATKDGIGLGKIGTFMGALNSTDPSIYIVRRRGK